MASSNFWKLLLPGFTKKDRIPAPLNQRSELNAVEKKQATEAS
jgi:hypothetical protein